MTKQAKNMFDGKTNTCDSIVWKHGVNDQFEFWHTNDSKSFWYDVARRLADEHGVWAVYQHDRRTKDGSSLLLNGGTTHLDGSFTHGVVYHTTSLDPYALMRDISPYVYQDIFIDAEPIRAEECGICIQEGRVKLPEPVPVPNFIANGSIVMHGGRWICTCHDNHGKTDSGKSAKLIASILNDVASLRAARAADSGDAWIVEETLFASLARLAQENE